MSIKINDVLDEMKARLVEVLPEGTQDHNDAIDFTGRVIVCYEVDDLLNKITNTKNFPILGVVYEGTRSKSENKPSENMGLACESVFSIILVTYGDNPVFSQNTKTTAIQYLDEMRLRFLGQRSTATSHPWGFQTESPAELKKGIVCWAQRWTLPVTFRPRPRRG